MRIRTRRTRSLSPAGVTTIASCLVALLLTIAWLHLPRGLLDQLGALTGAFGLFVVPPVTLLLAKGRTPEGCLGCLVGPFLVFVTFGAALTLFRDTTAVLLVVLGVCSGVCAAYAYWVLWRELRCAAFGLLGQATGFVALLAFANLAGELAPAHVRQPEVLAFLVLFGPVSAGSVLAPMWLLEAHWRRQVPREAAAPRPPIPGDPLAEPEGDET